MQFLSYWRDPILHLNNSHHIHELLEQHMATNSNTRNGPSFSLKNRCGRALWNAVWIIAFRYSPRPLHIWRALLLNIFGGEIAYSAHIYPAVRVWAPWNLKVGKNAGIGDNTILYSQGTISIGDKTVISQGCHLCTGTHDYNDPGFRLLTKSINIGNDCWIAAECFIHPGVTIEDGCVLAARSVATHALPAWTICAGMPAIVIKKRERTQ